MTKHSSEILVPGNPPLKRNILKSFQEMIEKSLNCLLNDEQKDTFQKNLINEWKSNEQSHASIISSQQMFYEIKDQIKALPEEKQPFAWQEFGRQLYVYAQTEGKNDVLGQFVISLYHAKENILVEGNPPLSQQTAESYVEMSAFVYGITNQKQVNLSASQKEQMISDLAKNFLSYPRETQEQISQANALWGQLRYNWKQANKEEQEAFRKELLQYVSDTKTQDIAIQSSQESTVEETNGANLAKDTSTDTNQEETPTTKAISPKFLDVVNRLRAKAIKSSLFSSQRKSK